METEREQLGYDQSCVAQKSVKREHFQYSKCNAKY